MTPRVSDALAAAEMRVKARLVVRELQTVLQAHRRRKRGEPAAKWEHPDLMRLVLGDHCEKGGRLASPMAVEAARNALSWVLGER